MRIDGEPRHALTLSAAFLTVLLKNCFSRPPNSTKQASKLAWLRARMKYILHFPLKGQEVVYQHQIMATLPTHLAQLVQEGDEAL